MALADRDVARYAWECITHVDPKHLRDYRQAVRGAASTLRMSGLAPACALWEAKGGASKTLYDHVEQWLRRRVYPDQDGGGGSTRLVQRIVDDASKYPRAKEEVLALLSWLKLFAEAKVAEEEQRKSRAQDRAPGVAQEQ
jgi:CRISPR type III-B/RAMP module-associated protein Cmr5